MYIKHNHADGTFAFVQLSCFEATRLNNLLRMDLYCCQTY